ncbi:MAG TPA: DUF4105 domain-containing protein [Chromatiales bacterium]|nr:DUF4105 domain-containing protein [Thiotrichales bacterium]HIP69401.1 DUF4105 domain-containing protein [Chromatiales bacterium]
MKLFFTLIFLLVFLYVIHGALSIPRLDRNWTADQKVLADISFNEETVTIRNIRNIAYRSIDDYDVSFYDKTIKLDEIESAWYLVEPFGRFGAAHTLASFGFKDGSYIAVSAEIRKEAGEKFSPLKGILRNYELVYVVADESDVIKLRTNYRKDEVRLYPIKADKEKIQSVFIDMLKRAQKLAMEPEFYNTITNNCTTNLVQHVRKFSDKDIPWYDLRYLMPEHSDEVAYSAGILNTDLSMNEARQVFSITIKAQHCSEREDFSACIRR